LKPSPTRSALSSSPATNSRDGWPNSAICSRSPKPRTNPPRSTWRTASSHRRLTILGSARCATPWTLVCYTAR
jgi:hypothetical protein